ncbi:MAG TPA: mersacidin/lichenicidin family type 2 lantibiotic [Blastocatellia bacterium]|nr:mersacidin/lichenicidin family type 2 lantibiotic [Blastocatellia bacterium]
MPDLDKIIRAWKDEDYRLSLSLDEQRALPANPAGSVELSNADLKAGGTCATSVLIQLLTICI